VAAYGGSQAPLYPDQLLAAVRETTFAFCRKFRVGEGEAVRYFKEVQAEAVGHKDELLDSIAESAVLSWTSAKRLTLAPGTTIEFCSLLNRILREHDPDLLPSACVVVRGINLLCVMRRDESKLLYPPGGESHRGGGLPLQHVPFFAPGKKFRVPMFLATSFNVDVAFKYGAGVRLDRLLRSASRCGSRFWLMAFDAGLPPVHWIVRVDPKGEKSLMCVLPVRAALLLRDVQRRRSPLQARQPCREEQRQGRSGVSFRAIFRLHRCVSARARQAHRQQPHRHRAGGCHRQP